MRQTVTPFVHRLAAAKAKSWNARRLAMLLAALAGTGMIQAKSYPVDGIVVAMDPAARTILVSHRPIPKYMGAMTMPFRVANASELQSLHPGVRVEFELVVSRNSSIARNIRKMAVPDVEIPAPKEKLRIGEMVPDFQLVDQLGRPVRFSEFRGRVVAINFVYTRCPLPDVCPRLAANFALLQRQFSGQDLVLLSVTVDPEYDTPAVLAEYARRWAANYSIWRFLTGDVARVAAEFGEVYWSDEGSIGHNSTTSIAGRDGRLAAIVEGSSYRVDQLRDLIARQLGGGSR
jgi:protein SCO1/2